MYICSKFWINFFGECLTSSVYENSLNFDEGVRPGLFDMMQKGKKILHLSSVDYITCQIL